MDDLKEKSDYVERLLAATKVERYAYLAICVLSAAVLLVFATIALIRNGSNVATILGMFGSSGVITYSTGQIMRVWNDAIRVVLPNPKENPVGR